jgi:heme exporter protein A
LIRILATLLRPSAGALTIGGVDALRDQTHARSLLGMAGERTLLSLDLTARENLRFYARLYGVRRIDWAVDAALSELDVRNLANHPVRTLSRGMQQRVSLARAILHDPLVLLLDEPETALDQAAQQRLAAVLAERGSRGRATLVVSHRPDWTQTIANRSVLLTDGLAVSVGVPGDRTRGAAGPVMSAAGGRPASALEPASEGAAQQ